METVTLLLFAAVLTGCILLDLSVLVALAVGYGIFFGYGLLRKHPAGELLRWSLDGVKAIRNIMVLFVLIGMMTALWRAAGTIPAIVYYAAGAVGPSVMLLMSFLLNCMVSVLTGSSFGTVATMGVVCMTMARSMGVDAVLEGGAILSGIYFGDRCSPVSSSALLVAEVTGTDIFRNIRGMLRTSVVPFVLSCAIYAGLGFLSGGAEGGSVDVQALFAENFRLGFLPLLPAALVLILSLCHVRVKAAIAVSVASAFIISVFYQGAELLPLLRSMVLGYRCPAPDLAAMLDGGGIVSMVKAGVIVCLSSCYAGIFQGTGLLNGLKGKIRALAERTSTFAAVLVTSVVTCAVGCNQTLPTMLAKQLCGDIEPDAERLAIDIENSSILVAALLPWSIAVAVPLSTVGAPSTAILAACYVYLIPLWTLLTRRERPAPVGGERDG